MTSSAHASPFSTPAAVSAAVISAALASLADTLAEELGVEPGTLDPVALASAVVAGADAFDEVSVADEPQPVTATEATSRKGASLVTMGMEDPRVGDRYAATMGIAWEGVGSRMVSAR
jgi:hypothetical protein